MKWSMAVNDVKKGKKVSEEVDGEEVRNGDTRKKRKVSLGITAVGGTVAVGAKDIPPKINGDERGAREELDETMPAQPSRRNLRKQPTPPPVVEKTTRAPAQRPPSSAPREGKKLPALKITKQEKREAYEAEQQALREGEEEARANAVKLKAKGKGRMVSEPLEEVEDLEDEVVVEDGDDDVDGEGEEAEDEEARIEEGEEEYHDSPPPPSKPKRKPRVSRARGRAASSDEEEEVAPRRQRKKLVFPIKVYRLHGDNIPSRGVRVNPVDVLRTLFEEKIDDWYTKLDSKIQKRAIESYKEELQALLLRTV
jgi:hypothetical protein